MHAWFEYFTDRSGENREDDINESHLVELRDVLHTLIWEEAGKLRMHGGCRRIRRAIPIILLYMIYIYIYIIVYI